MPPQPPHPPVPTPSQRYKDGHTYIPPHAERAIAEQMQRTLPADLKQYADAFMEQHVGSSSLAGLSGSPQDSQPPHAPALHASRQATSFRDGQTAAPPPQPPADPLSLEASLAAAPPPIPLTPPQPVQPVQPGQTFQPDQPLQTPQPVAPASGPANSYDFMTPAAKPGPRPGLPGFSLPRPNSLPLRIAYAAGGLLVLLILISIVKGLVVGSPDLTSFVSVAQDQQELIHIVSGTTAQQQNLSTTSQNLAATSQLVLTSAQGALLNYLSLNHQKVTAKTLGLKLSTSIDSQLTAAAGAATYDQTFQQIMSTQLKAYRSDLSGAYAKATGAHGKALLKSDFNQAGLLLTQLNQPAQ